MTRLLVLNFFPAFVPPSSGGELRCHHLYRRLSATFDVTMVAWTHPDRPEEVVHFGETLREHRIPKGDAFERALRALHDRGVAGELAGVACALAGREATRYHEVVRSLLPAVDAVVHEFPYTLPYDTAFGRDGIARFYNSHNVEAEMARALFAGGAAAELRALVARLERRLVAGARRVFATGEADALAFRVLAGAPASRLRLARNGFDEETLAPRPDAPAAGRPAALFLGSRHPPNVEGARFIASDLAPALPALDFLIAGDVCRSLGRVPGNVRLLGAVDEETKRRLFAEATLFVNPVFRGSGTSLKMVEAMAAGLPIVSTARGARGLDLPDGVYAPAEAATFAAVTAMLAAEPERRRRLGAAARRAAAARFGWTAIAASVAAEIAAALAGGDADAGPPDKPRLLVVNDYSVRAPVSGGARRVAALTARLAATWDVRLLCLHDGVEPEIERLAPDLHEVRIPRTGPQASFATAVNAVNAVPVDDIAAALFAPANPALVETFGRLAADSDVVVLSHPYLAPLLETTGRIRPVVYEAHNVEAHLKAELLRGHSDGAALTAFVAALERFAVTHADAVIAVAEEDRQAFLAAGGGTPVAVVANGTDLPAAALLRTAARRRHAGRPVAVFVGSAHPPNVEAARFLCEVVAPALPEVEFRLIGSVGDALADIPLPPNLRRLGVVPDRRRRDLLLEATVALNPVTGGGGSNLKLADYFAHGLPTLSTPEGARGFAVVGGRELMVAGRPEFATALAALLADDGMRMALGRAARAFAARRLDWAALAEAYDAVLRARTPQWSPRRPLRLLVVAGRYGEPPPGEAEESLARLLGALADGHDVRIDLFALADTAAGTAHPAGLVAPFADDIRLFTTDQRAGDARERQDVGDAEGIALARRLQPLLDRTCLMGGWEPVDGEGGVARRRSGAEAELFVAAGTVAVRLFGHGPVDGGPVRIAVDGEAYGAGTLAEGTALRIDLDPARPHRVTLRVATPAREDGGPRRPGMRLRGLEVAQAATPGWVDVPLSHDYERLCRAGHRSAWIAALRAQAAARPPATDRLVQRLDPGSRTLLAALEDTAADHDLVLLHGLPVALADGAAALLRGRGMPYAVFPRGDLEDRPAHRRAHYDALRGAACVFASSEAVCRLLLDPLGAVGVRLPGAGVRLAEFADRIAAQRRFRRFHGSDVPYFLVIDRGDGAAGTALAVAALRRLKGVELVLVAADADGPAAGGAPVIRYGRLDGDLTVGALAGCVAAIAVGGSGGTVLAAAWAAGRPVIADRACAAHAELVRDGVDGFLADTVEELADRMARLAGDAALAARMGAAGRDAAFRDLGWPAIAARFHAALARAARQPDSGRSRAAYSAPTTAGA
ncbi:glycosyltransferase [Azospirillum sp. ST 5-10]|uniref:glycosyltransferase n=1 Tax=unclassified Azospirillum TaxID=2630922 RepID=UPI003F4A680C